MDKNYQRSIRRLRERCREEDDISDADGEAILGFSDRIELLGSRYSDERHEFHLMRLVNMAQSVGGLAAALEDRGAAEEIVRWIHREYDNPETNKDYRVSLRMFGEHATDGEGKPESIDWVPSGYESTYDPAPDPSHMLHWEKHIIPMIEACHNNRDKALIAVAWDLGARPGELYDLTLVNFSDGTFGWKVTLHGKRGQRSPTIIPAVPYVQNWFTDHPAHDPNKDPLQDSESVDAPLWSKLHSNDQISYKMMTKILKEAARRPGVTRPVTPSIFRKSSASYLASQNVSQAHIENHHGWSRGSEVAARYIAVFGKESAREVARAHGVDVSADEPDPTAPLTCPRCRNDTPRHEPTCVHCSHPMDQSAVEALETAQQAISKDLVDLEESGLRAAANEALEEMFADEDFLASTVARYMQTHSSGTSP